VLEAGEERALARAGRELLGALGQSRRTSVDTTAS
jgi:hypothetical protein